MFAYNHKIMMCIQIIVVVMLRYKSSKLCMNFYRNTHNVLPDVELTFYTKYLIYLSPLLYPTKVKVVPTFAVFIQKHIIRVCMYLDKEKQYVVNPAIIEIYLTELIYREVIPSHYSIHFKLILIFYNIYIILCISMENIYNST